MRTSRGFTFVELLAAIAVIGMLFIPLLHMFTAGLRTLEVASLHQRAVDLAVEELERLRLGDATAREPASIEKQIQDEDGRAWTVRRQSEPHPDAIELRIQVFQGAGRETPEFELVTFQSDFASQ